MGIFAQRPRRTSPFLWREGEADGKETKIPVDISQRNETLFMNEIWGQPGKTRMNSTQNLGHQCGVHEYIIPDDSPDKHGKNESHIAHDNHL